LWFFVTFVTLCFLTSDLIHGALGADEVDCVDAVGGRFGQDAFADQLGDFIVASRADSEWVCADEAYS
jgi:hypothetical protein